MHPKALLEAATDLVHRVLRFEHPADRVVADFFRDSRALGARERHALGDTVFAILRELPLLRHLAPLGQRRGRAPAGAARLVRQRRLPAGGDERRRDRTGSSAAGATPREALPEALRHNLPDWLAQPLREALGEDEFGALAASLDRPAPLDLRVNPPRPAARSAGRACRGRHRRRADAVRAAGRLRVRKARAAQPAAFCDGAIEVQDEGSQLLALLTGAKRGEMVVDFCAGAGGKTLALGALMRNTGRLYAFDVSEKRLAKLKPRLARTGLSNVHPAQIAHERDERIKRLAGKIDRVLVDAPCSGSARCAAIPT